MAFFRDGFDFVKSEVGEGNMVHFTVHMDESTPHAHFGFTPIKDGTLSWKNYFDGRDALRGWQDRFFEKVSKPWGLERGEKDTGRTHKDAAQMRRDAEREIKELDKRKECLRQEVEEMEAATPSLPEGIRTLWKARNDGSREEGLGSDLEGLRSQINDFQGQIAELDRRADEIERSLPRLRARCASLGERLESVRQAAGRLEEDVEELEAIASLADKFDHAGRFEKRGILDEIAARCDGLRGRVEQVVEGIRGAVGRLEVAIANLARKLGPRSARMTTRALKRDLAALEEDMSPVTLASEAREAARASNARRGNVPQRDRGQSR